MAQAPAGRDRQASCACAKWLHDVQEQTLPKVSFGEAVRYVLRQERALTRYLRCGFVTLDNSCAEREMMRIATGCKDYLFAGGDEGGETAAVLYSFVSTCQRHKIDAWLYLRDVLPGRWRPQPPALRPRPFLRRSNSRLQHNCYCRPTNFLFSLELWAARQARLTRLLRAQRVGGRRRVHPTWLSWRLRIPQNGSVESMFKDRIPDEDLRIDSKPRAVNIRVLAGERNAIGTEKCLCTGSGYRNVVVV